MRLYSTALSTTQSFEPDTSETSWGTRVLNRQSLLTLLFLYQKCQRVNFNEDDLTADRISAVFKVRSRVIQHLKWQFYKNVYHHSIVRSICYMYRQRNISLFVRFSNLRRILRQIFRSSRVFRPPKHTYFELNLLGFVELLFLLRFGTFSFHYGWFSHSILYIHKLSTTRRIFSLGSLCGGLLDFAPPLNLKLVWDTGTNHLLKHKKQNKRKQTFHKIEMCTAISLSDCNWLLFILSRVGKQNTEVTLPG